MVARPFATAGWPDKAGGAVSGIGMVCDPCRPPILLGMFIWGSVNASSDLTRTDNAYNFRFAGESADHSAIFLRNFDKGVLLRDPVGNKIEFHRWDNIVTISGPVTKTTSIGCRLFNWCVVLAPPS